jgi:phosphoglycerate kinase
MPVKFIEDLELDGRRVFLRADLNVPLTEDREVADDNRIVQVLPTIKYALRNGARLILSSHLGRPKGEKNEKFSMMPVAQRLSELLDRDVIMSPDCISDGVKVVANQLKEGELLLLENLRFHPGETTNDPDFARALAGLAEVYINDAFGASHRAHASVAGVPQYIADKGAGMLIRKELRYLKFAIEDPEPPYLAILGGAKVSDKIGVIRNLLKSINVLCIGGGMAYTFLKKKGVAVGKSLVEDGKLSLAGQIIDEAKSRGVQLLLPVDHLVSEKLDGKSVSRVVSNDKGIDDNFYGVDIGPETIAIFEQAIGKAKTIVWNGPMGIFEVDKFSEGTMALANAVAASDAISIIGGGDSASAMKKAGVADQVTHISTGGGASLELLEGKVLPGLAALETD